MKKVIVVAGILIVILLFLSGAIRIDINRLFSWIQVEVWGKLTTIISVKEIIVATVAFLVGYWLGRRNKKRPQQTTTQQ